MKIKLLILSFVFYGLTNAQNITASFTPIIFCLNSSPMCFTDLSTSNNGSINSWLWNFGDGGTSTTQNPCWAYTSPGNFNVCLTVKNINGDSNKTCSTIIVFPNPVVTFTGGTITCCMNDPSITLNGGPSGGTFSGNGVSGNYFYPSIAGIGTHTLTYSYADLNGCESNATRTFIVDPCTDIEDTKPGDLQVLSENGQIIFTHTSFFANNYSVSIYNALGQFISLKKFSGNCNDCFLSNSTLKAGIYFVNFSDGIKEKMFKILIQ